MLSPELFFILIALVVIVVFFVATALIIGGIFFYAFKNANENLKVWKELSEELNLQMPDPKDSRLTGEYNDLEVDIKTKAKTVRMYSRIEAYQFTGCIVKFSKPLGLSLDLKYPKVSAKKLAYKSLIIGQTDFDSNFDATCQSREDLQKLLLSNTDSKTNQNLLGDLLQTVNYIETASYNPALIKVRHEETDPAFVITDEAVFIKFRTNFGEDVSKLKQLLDVTTYLAKQIYIARSNIQLTD